MKKTIFIFVTFIPWLFCLTNIHKLQEQLDPSVVSLLNEKSEEVRDFLYLQKNSMMKDYIFIFLSLKKNSTESDLLSQSKKLENVLESSPYIAHTVFSIKDIRRYLKESEYLNIPIESFEILKNKTLLNKEATTVKETESRVITNLKSKIRDQYAQLKTSELKKTIFYKNDYLINKKNMKSLIIVEPVNALTDMSRIKEFYSQLNNLVEHNVSDLNVRYLGTSYSLLLEYESLWNGLKKSFYLSIFFLLISLLMFFRSLRATLVTMYNLATSLCISISIFIISGLSVNINIGYLLVIIAGSSINYAIALSFYYISSSHKNYNKVLKSCIRPFLLGGTSTFLIYLVLLFSNLALYKDFAIVGSFGSLITISSIFLISYFTSFLLDSCKIYAFNSFKLRCNFKRSKYLSFLSVKKCLLVILVCNLSLLSIYYLKSIDLIETNSFQFRSKNYSLFNSKSFNSDLNNFSMKLTFIPVLTIISSPTEILNLQRGISNSSYLKSSVGNFRVYSLYDFIPNEQKVKNEYIRLFKKENDLHAIYNSPYVDEWGEYIVSSISNVKLREFYLNDLPTSLVKSFSTQKEVNDVLYLNFDINKIEKNINNIKGILNEIKNISKRLSTERVLLSGSLPILVKVYDYFSKDIFKILISVILITFILLGFFSYRYKQLYSSLIFLNLVFFLFFGLILVFNIKLNILNFIAVLITIGIGIDYLMNFNLAKNTAIPDRFNAYVMVFLMSATTTISYFSILITTDHKLMLSFALLCLLGEFITILSAMIVTLYGIED